VQVVDSLFVTSFRLGRRKTWIVPVQALCGLLMFFASYYVDGWLGDLPVEGGQTPTQAPEVLLLTVLFGGFFFLMATQDIAVDGWALTLLSRQNVGYASTCNTVGQTAGYVLSYVLFLAFSSPAFCNKYIRTVPDDHGIVSLSQFMCVLGVFFICITTIVWLFKKEEEPEGSTLGPPPRLWDSYVTMWDVICLPSVKALLLILLTCKVGFGAVDGLFQFKVIERGVPNETVRFIGVCLTPVSIIISILLADVARGKKPLDVFLKVYPMRLLVGVGFALLIILVPQAAGGEIPAWFYLIVVVFFIIHDVCSTAMSAGLMVSDCSIYIYIYIYI
jgi:PAT family acetyl-CoA transporter-like MFS transporter 1